jgi:hypothetical protein
VAKVGLAIEAWIAAACDAGLSIPGPRYQPRREAAE